MAKTPDRPKRIPVSGVGRNILTVVGKDPNYAYRWVNDTDQGMRIEKFKQGGWEVVQKDTEIKVGDRVVDQGSVVGSSVTRYVGQKTTAVLMRIPLEWFEEDQAAKQAELDAIDEAMRAEASAPGNYGSLTVTHRK